SEAWRRLVTEAFTVPRSSPEPKDHPYPIGPRADLLGRPVSELQVGPPAESTVSLDLPDVFRDPVDAANGVLPALVSGVMRGPTAADSQVVVAVNDRVAGVSPIFGRGDGTEGFMVLAPESFFKTGKNSLRLFLVDDDFFRPLRY
ncbi:MAG: hypothetical protein ACRDI1_11655, partial [Actinomycetota bacterium]